MDSNATPFDAAAAGSRRAILRRNPDDVAEIEMIEAVWGSNPQFSDGISYEFIRAEGLRFEQRQVMQWLDLSHPEAELLVTPPAQMFRI